MQLTEHLLVCLAEELMEVGRECMDAGIRVSKALRFGISEVQPGQIFGNADRIVAELADLRAMIARMEAEGIITPQAIEAKGDKLARYMELSRKCGTLEVT